jgi:DnaJ-class molecular chaperone
VAVAAYSVTDHPASAGSLQPTLPWPGVDETCPKCCGTGDVYYLHAHEPAVQVVGGKRVTCPVCSGQGTVRVPVSSRI